MIEKEPRFRITNGLGEQRIVALHDLKKLEEDFALFKEATFQENVSLKDSECQYLEGLWTITTVEVIK